MNFSKRIGVKLISTAIILAFTLTNLTVNANASILGGAITKALNSAAKSVTSGSGSSSSSGSKTSGSSSGSTGSKSASSSSSSSSGSSKSSGMMSISDAQKAWSDARARGDTKGMEIAHAQAEAIRKANDPSYKGSTDGSSFKGSNSTATTYVNVMNNLKSQFYSSSDQHGKDVAHEAAEQIRKQIDSGYTGSVDGSSDKLYYDYQKQIAANYEQLSMKAAELKKIADNPYSTTAEKQWAAEIARSLGLEADLTYSDSPKTDLLQQFLGSQGIPSLGTLPDNVLNNSKNIYVDPKTGQTINRYLGVDSHGNLVNNPNWPQEASDLAWQNEKYWSIEDIKNNKAARSMLGLNNTDINYFSKEQEEQLAQMYIDQSGWKGWSKEDIMKDFVFTPIASGVVQIKSVHMRSDGLGMYYKTFYIDTMVATQTSSLSIIIPPPPTNPPNIPTPPTLGSIPSSNQPPSSGDQFQVVTKTIKVPVFEDVSFETTLNATVKITAASGQIGNISKDNVQDKIPVMKSGYGFTVDVSSWVTLWRSDPSIDPDNIDQISNAESAWIEFNGNRYSLETGPSTSQKDNWTRSFRTPVNSSSVIGKREIFVPAGLPDGIYDIKICVANAHSPVGTMTQYLDGKLEIKAHMYEDDNTGSM